MSKLRVEPLAVVGSQIARVGCDRATVHHVVDAIRVVVADGVADFVTNQPRVNQRLQAAGARTRGIQLNEPAVDADRRAAALTTRRGARPLDGDPAVDLLARGGAARDFYNTECLARPGPDTFDDGALGRVEGRVIDAASAVVHLPQVEAQRPAEDADGFEAVGRFITVLEKRAIEHRLEPSRTRRVRGEDAGRRGRGRHGTGARRQCSGEERGAKRVHECASS